MYKVIERFKDKNHKHIYEIGDIYPKKGISVDSDRLVKLSSGDNALAKAVIQKIEEKVESQKDEKRNTKKTTAKKDDKK